MMLMMKMKAGWEQNGALTHGLWSLRACCSWNRWWPRKRLMGLVHTAHQSDLDFKSEYIVILRALKSHQLCYIPKKNYLEKCFLEFRFCLDFELFMNLVWIQFLCFLFTLQKLNWFHIWQKMLNKTLWAIHTNDNNYNVLNEWKYVVGITLII